MKLESKKVELLQSIHDYLQFQLDTILDFNQISSINKEFQSISDNTRGILNEKYFEIDDESFITDFIEQLSEKDILKISSLSKEEGKYCVLNLLNKIKPDQPIYIVKTKDCWLKANANLSGYIMIPDFTAEEIPAMKANKTIFIQSLNSDDRICLPLPRRSRSFLAEKLRANGYEDAFTEINRHISKIVSDMADKDKEAIKTTMRKIVYNHRKYADSDREITAERISQIEQLCLSIKFNDDTYDFIYLLNNDDIPIMRPAVFNDTNSNYLEDEKKTKEKIVEEEISRMKSLGIDLGHYLQLMDSKSYNHIGKYLALYYSDLQYSEAVLNSIINSTNNETVAVDYIKSCFQDNINGILETVDDMIEKGYSSTLYVSLLSVVPLNNKTIEYIEKLSIEDKKIYWSKPLLHIYNDKSIVKYLTDNLFNYSNWAQLFQILLYNGTMFSVEDTISIINRSIHKIIAEKYSFIGLDTYCIELILVNAYKQIGNQFDKFPELLNIEIQLFPYIKWKNMKCSQYMFKRNANLYAEVLSIIYKHDDNKPPKENIDSNVITRFFRLEHDIRFCPGEENGTINTRILKEWIETFRQQLTNQGQYYLFYEKLGHLFAFSPKGEDGIVPHESIRHIIEQSENNDIINGFVNSIYFDRGVYALTAGKNESRLAQEYSKLAKRLQIYYPKTAKIYSSLSERYKYDSIRDRKRAEDNII